MRKCTNCGKGTAAITLRYMKTSLCKNCFSELFERRVKRTIRQNKLLDKRDKVAVALSGGKDSMVLLKILHKISKKAPNSKLIAISVDEGTIYRNNGLLVSEKFCKELGVEHHLYKFKKEFKRTLPEIMKKVSKLDRKAPSCSYCGVLRRKLLNDKALELKATKIATGHNLDDEAQTALMNFIRADYDRMARSGAFVGVIKNKKFVPKIKPLRECPEEEVRMYAKLNHVPFYSAKCPYSKDAFRRKIRGMLSEIEKTNPGIKFQLVRSVDKIMPILRENSLKKGPINECKFCGALTSGTICKVCELRKIVGF